MPQPPTHKTPSRLQLHIVRRIRALPARTTPRSRKIRFIRRLVAAEPDIAIDPESQVLRRQVRDRVIEGGDSIAETGDEGVEIRFRGAVVGVVGLEPGAVVVVEQVGEEVEGVGVDGGVLVGGFAGGARFGEADEDFLSWFEVGFDAGAPEFLAFGGIGVGGARGGVCHCGFGGATAAAFARLGG